MIKLEKPDISQDDIIDACIANLRKEPTLSNINNSRKHICKKNNEYDKLGEKGELRSIHTHSIVPGGVTKDDMVFLYDKKFVGDGGRKYYDKIKSIPKFERCPFCGIFRVSTLDHYLPKTEYPTYALSPFNLVASCSNCNTKKNSLIFASREEELIHPYYDDFDDEIWLKCKVEYGEDILFSFFVDKPLSWSEEKYHRAKNHFDKLELNKLYQAHAAEEFTEYIYSAKKLYEAGGEKSIKENLQERLAEHRSIYKNTWKAALYDGLLNSEEFLEEFFL